MKTEKIYDKDKFKTQYQKTYEKKGKKAAEEELKEDQLAFLDKMESEQSATAHIKETEDEKLKKGKEVKEEVMDFLDFNRKSYSSYRVNLSEWGMYQLMSMDLPFGWHYHCIPTKTDKLDIYGKSFDTKEGIVFVLRSPDKKVYVRAMRCTYEVPLDLRAMTNMLLSVENTVENYGKELELKQEKEIDRIVKQNTKGHLKGDSVKDKGVGGLSVEGRVDSSGNKSSTNKG